MIVATARDAADLLAPRFAGSEVERLVVLHLDPQRRLLALDEETAEDSERSLRLSPRRIVTRALTLGSTALVIAHSHPSGDPTPSEADLDATRGLGKALAALDIRLVDHLVFAGGEFHSVRGSGLL